MPDALSPLKGHNEARVVRHAADEGEAGLFGFDEEGQQGVVVAHQVIRGSARQGARIEIATPEDRGDRRRIGKPDAGTVIAEPFAVKPADMTVAGPCQHDIVIVLPGVGHGDVRRDAGQVELAFHGFRVKAARAIVSQPQEGEVRPGSVGPGNMEHAVVAAQGNGRHCQISVEDVGKECARPGKLCAIFNGWRGAATTSRLCCADFRDCARELRTCALRPACGPRPLLNDLKMLQQKAVPAREIRGRRQPRRGISAPPRP